MTAPRRHLARRQVQLPELPASWLAEDRASLVGRWCERRGTPIEREAWIVEDGVIVGVRLVLSEVT